MARGGTSHEGLVAKADGIETAPKFLETSQSGLSAANSAIPRTSCRMSLRISPTTMPSTMTLVVDASVACKWFIAEAASDAAEALVAGGQMLLAPDLIVPEVCNVVPWN